MAKKTSTVVEAFDTMTLDELEKLNRVGGPLLRAQLLEYLISRLKKSLDESERLSNELKSTPR